ncbi:MAG: hypothetical protein KAQ84_01465 [Thermoplasmatales archaeon]|nr:hypothetical protein [Thermoplasmatales archaeon]
MINLKKNDKLIVIIAVAVIIIAAIGIAAYSSPDTKINGLLGTGGNMYTVTWEEKTGSSIISEFAGKNAPYSESYIISAPTGSVCVLTNVDFQITWQDDKTIGIIFKRGLDTLTAEITSMDGESQPYEGKGGGNKTLSFRVNDMPYSDSIEAEDVNEAEQIAYNMFTGQDTTSFDVTVRVKTGEPLRRPLKYFSDKGNDFEIKVTYEYYYASLTEEGTEGTGSDGGDGSFDDLKEEEYVPPFLSMIIGTGCGRYI